METTYRPLPLDRFTRRWWVFLALLVLLFLPSYTSRALHPAETPRLLLEVLSNSLIYWLSALFPLFKLLPLLLIIGLLANPGGFTRAFHFYVSLNLVLIAFLQNSGDTPSYGFAIITGNVLVYGLLAALWGWEAVAKHGWLELRGKALWQYWVVFPALLAYLFPVRITAGFPEPDFSPLRLLANEAGLTFCMMLPVYLAVLALAAPRVNRVVMRVSAFVGMITGLLNMVEFLSQPLYGWWMGMLHLPLLVISVYAFVLSFTRPEPAYPPL